MLKGQYNMAYGILQDLLTLMPTLNGMAHPLIYLGTNPTSWQEKKLPTVLRSSTESEYISFSHTSVELSWMCHILQDLHIPLPKAPILHCDNVSALSVAHNLVIHTITKHIEGDYHYI